MRDRLAALYGSFFFIVIAVGGIALGLFFKERNKDSTLVSALLSAKVAYADVPQGGASGGGTTASCTGACTGGTCGSGGTF